MWLILASLSVLLVNAEILPGNSRIIRDVSDGVRSLGYEIVYGDEEMSIINEVVTDMEKENILKSKQRLTDSIKPLPAEDVKCLMSVDRYCSKEMGQMKSVLIRAVKDDCANCSNKEKDDAGKVIASMMAHDPSAWKMFLTRYNGLQRVQRILG